MSGINGHTSAPVLAQRDLLAAPFPVWRDTLRRAVLDALTGLPVDEVVATWAIAADAMTADGVATALFLADPGAIPRGLGAAWARISASGRIEVSDGFPGEVFT